MANKAYSNAKESLKTLKYLYEFSGQDGWYLQTLTTSSLGCWGCCINGACHCHCLPIFSPIQPFWQKNNHRKQLKMSKHEVQQEYKESEGDPHIKGERKQRHMEMLNETSVGRAREATVQSTVTLALPEMPATASASRAVKPTTSRKSADFNPVRASSPCSPSISALWRSPKRAPIHLNITSRRRPIWPP